MKNKSFWKDIPYATRFAIGQFLYMFLLLVFIFCSHICLSSNDV